MSDATSIAIDRSGRVVIPKRIRDAAGFEPGVPLEVRVRDGVVELSVAPRDIELVRKGRLLVARALEPGPTLTAREVSEAIDADRQRR